MPAEGFQSGLSLGGARGLGSSTLCSLQSNPPLPVPPLPLQLPPYVLGRLHLLRDKDRDAVMDKAQALAFLAALMNLLSGNSFIKVRSMGGCRLTCEGR